MSGSKSSRRFLGSSRTPTFHPPSYYAAAAGLQYPSSSDRSPAVDTYGQQDNTYPAYPTADTPSEDSRKSSSSSRSRTRSVSLSRTLLPGSHGHREEKEKGKHERGKSQIMDIPFLETSLLPSLRDTIDKMTHPPRPEPQGHLASRDRDSEDFGTSPGPSHDLTRASLNALEHQDVARSPVLSPGYTSAIPVHTSSNKAGPSVSAGSSGLRTPKISTPKVAFSHVEEGSPAIPSGIAKTPRSALKSSSRTPQSLSPVPPQPSASPATPGKSLRSIRSLITPKQSSSAQLTPNLPSSSQFRSPILRSPRLPNDDVAVRPDSGTGITRSKTKPASHNASPNIHLPSSVGARSNIPRPRFACDSGSELEREYGRSNTPGKLVVANAVVEPSSPDTDMDRTNQAPTSGQSRLRTPKDLRSGLLEKIQRLPQANSSRYPAEPGRILDRSDSAQRSSTIGLGLRIYPQTYQHDGLEVDDDRSVYDDTDDEQAHMGPGSEDYSDTASQHHPVYTDDESVYDDRDNFHDTNFPYDYRAEDHQEGLNRNSGTRQQALAGLIDGMQAHFGPQPDMRRLSHPESESPYRVEGIAVSDSQDYAYGQANILGEERWHSRDQDVQDTEEPQLSRSRSRRTSTYQSQASSATPSAGPSGTSSSAIPVRKSSGRRDTRSSSVPPGGRSSSRQEQPLQYDPSPAEQRPYQSEYGAAPASTKSHHRLSRSLGRLSERFRESDPANNTMNSYGPRDTEDRREPRSRESDRDVGNKPMDLAMRERERFGIPASLSYGGAESPNEAIVEPEGHHREQYVRSESENSLSSVEELCRVGRNLSTSEGGPGQDTSGVLSTGAEALFRNLSSDSHVPRQGRKEPRRNSASNSAKSKASRRRSSSVPQPSDANNITALPNPWSSPGRQSAEGAYSQNSAKSGVLTTWKSRMHPTSYRMLLSKHGAVEMQRQELLYEQYLCQQDFVLRLRIIVRVFIVPLRRKHTKTWIPGVPILVTRLFDWLEDIVNLHASIHDAYEEASRAWDSGIIVHIASTLRGFVPQLEVYQPYLVRVDEVRDLLTEQNAAHEEFAEFVRIREKHPDSGGWSLVDLLAQPVLRLFEFKAAFERLLTLTPSDHPDHLPTFSLHHSTRMIVYVLCEVKAREEEYEIMKDIAARMDGLLPSVQLAKRERRLLWHGAIVCSAESAAQDMLSGQNDQSSRRRGRDKSKATESRDGQGQDEMGCAVLQAFVFTDALLLARFVDGDAVSGPSWSLLSRFGISRIMGVADREPLSLNLLALSPSDLQTGLIPEGSAIGTVRISLPHPDEKSRADMLAAFGRCHAYTLRSLSFLSHTGNCMPHGAQVDFEHDTQQSVMAILNTGLPLPKSPSVQISDMDRLQAVGRANESDQEREERGWWALRFQQVMKEVQRQDPMLALETMDRTLQRK